MENQLTEAQGKKINIMVVEHQFVTPKQWDNQHYLEFKLWKSGRVCPFLPPSQDHFLHKSESHNKTTWVSKWSRVTLHHSLLWQRLLWQRGRELQRQTGMSSRREIGIRHERGWATSSSLEKKLACESSKQPHHWFPCSPGAAATHQVVRRSKDMKIPAPILSPHLCVVFYNFLYFLLLNNSLAFLFIFIFQIGSTDLNMLTVTC